MWRNLLWFGRKKRKYERLLDSEDGDTSISLGVESIVLFVVSIAAIIGAFVGGGMLQQGVMGVVILLVSALAEALLFVSGLYCAVLQNKLNDKAIGKIGIVLHLIALVAFAVVVFIAIK